MWLPVIERNTRESVVEKTEVNREVAFLVSQALRAERVGPESVPEYESVLRAVGRLGKVMFRESLNRATCKGKSPKPISPPGEFRSLYDFRDVLDLIQARQMWRHFGQRSRSVHGVVAFQVLQVIFRNARVFPLHVLQQRLLDKLGIE